MKRMNLIRAALFAVLAFMGSLSLSAQGNWLPPQQAAVVIINELNNLAQPPVPSSPVGGVLQTKQEQLSQNASNSGCTDCFLKKVKYTFLTETLVRIKQGSDTGAAVEDVRALMISMSNSNATMLNTIQQAYDWMQVIL